MSEDPERNLTAQGFIQRFIRKSSAQQQNVRILNAGCGQDLSIGTEFIDLYPCDERVKRWNADWEPIPFADESMDVVYSKCLLEHLGNPRFALTEMARVLRKGGKLRLTTDNGRYWRWVVGFGGAHHSNYKSAFGKDDKHYVIFYEGHLKALIESTGLKITQLQFSDDGLCHKKIDRMLRSLSLPRQHTYPRIVVEALKI